VLSLQLPAAFLILFDPVTHMARFLEVKGEPTRERQSLSLVLDGKHALSGTLALRPGPLRIALENRTDTRTLPGIWVAGGALHELLDARRPFLTAARLLSNQTFRDLYGTDTLDLRQRLKITSMTFLFTDLTGSTELYDRVGDLAAYELVRAHFRVLQEIITAEAGALVKTIGDAVMATFTAPERAMAAALRMREAIRSLREGGELLLKIGIHEGPCLAVMLNNSQDYFGRTVNVASRVQGLCQAGAIVATSQVVGGEAARDLLRARGLAPRARDHALRGVARKVALYEIT
jgi:class 3 adenylate cyclase